MEIRIECGFEHINQIEKIVKKVAEIEKEYRCDCTLNLIKVAPYQDFQEFYKRPQ